MIAAIARATWRALKDGAHLAGRSLRHRLEATAKRLDDRDAALAGAETGLAFQMPDGRWRPGEFDPEGELALTTDEDDHQ